MSGLIQMHSSISLGMYKHGGLQVEEDENHAESASGLGPLRIRQRFAVPTWEDDGDLGRSIEITADGRQQTEEKTIWIACASSYIFKATQRVFDEDVSGLASAVTTWTS